jgi:hypothetical protein
MPTPGTRSQYLEPRTLHFPPCRQCQPTPVTEYGFEREYWKIEKGNKKQSDSLRSYTGKTVNM